MDVKTAFLNRELDEEIYMDKPLCFESKGQKRKVCKLKRFIYDLKQASRQWNIKFHHVVLKDGFKMMEEDHCMYLKCLNNGFVILSLYVNEILLAENSKEMIDIAKKWLSSNFEMKHMGEANYVLGVKIVRDRAKRLLALSQETYIKRMLECYHMQDSKPMDTPVDKSLSLSRDMCPKTPEEKEKMFRVPYANAVGSLMYAMMYTCPDICYVVGLISRYQSNLRQKHWMAVKRILRYLKGTSDYMLCYQGKKDLRLISYSNADWGSDIDQSKSTSGYTFLLNDSAIL